MLLPLPVWVFGFIIRKTKNVTLQHQTIKILSMNIFQEAASKENKTLNVIFGSIAIGLLIAATYLTFSHHPIAKDISRWQSKLVSEKNKYYPVLTICILALPPLLILLPIKIFILRILKSQKIKRLN